MKPSPRQLPRMKTSKFLLNTAIALLLMVIFLIFARQTDTNFVNLVEGIPGMVDFVSRMVPPEYKIIPKLIDPTIVTFQISVMGTTLGVLLAFPLSFLGARNFTKSRILCNVIRLVFNVCRGVSELVWAILFVSMVGLGPFPGVLAQIVYATGILGKFFSEAVENMNQDSINALRTTGANRFQIAFQGVLPELLPNFSGYVLLNWEHNIRSATVLGLVGAGGIGLELMSSMRLFRYQEVLTILIVIVVMVTIVDTISAFIRKHFLTAV